MHETALRVARDPASDVMALLPAGALFEVLEIAGPSAWGVAVGPGLVGYIDGSAIDLAPDGARA